MIKDNRPVTIALAAGLALFAAAALLMFASLKREHDDKAALQNELAEVMKERKKLSLEVEELQLIKSDLDIKISSIEAEKKSLQENYDREKSQNDIIRSRLSKKDEEIKAVEEKLNAALSEKRKIQSSLSEEQERYIELKDRIDKLMLAKDTLEDKVRNIVNKQGIELERIVIKAEGELEGKVLVINRDYNFIVVNIGQRDEIRLGDLLTVFRDGKYVGEAKIEKIYDTMSAAAITKELKTGSIMINDNVVVRGN